MNQANLDYLYQVFAPATDRSPGASRSESDAVGFGVHLNQASTSVFDVVRTPRRDDTRQSASSSSDSRDADSNQPRPTATDDESHPAQSSTNRNSTSSTDSSGTASASASPQAGDSKSGGKGRNHNDREDDAAAGNDVAAGVTAASNAQAPQPPVNETKPSKEHDKEVADASTKAASKEAAEAAKTGSANKKNSGLHAVPSADKSIVEAATGDGEASESSTTSPENKPEDAAEAAKTRSAKHHGTDKDVPAEGGTSQAGEVPAAGKQTAATPTAEPTAAVRDTAKESVNAKRRTNAAVRDADEDHTAGDGKKNADAVGSKGSADKTANTPIAAAVSSGPTTAHADMESIAAKTGNDDKTATKPVANKTETALGPLGKSLRSAVEMTRGQKTANAGEAPQVDPARFVSRVARAIHTANERGGALQLRLAPPELGSLKIELSIKDGVMSAALEADNASARRLLLDHLPALRDRLAEQNIRVERFDVDVRQDDSGGQANSRGSNQNPFQQQQAEQQSQPRRTTSNASLSEPTTPAATVIAARITTTAINLVV